MNEATRSSGELLNRSLDFVVNRIIEKSGWKGLKFWER